MKLEKEITNDIPVSELPDGQIAVITKWLKEYEGLIVIRWKDFVFEINNPRIFWNNILNTDDTCRVRILEEGEKIIV